MLIIKSWLITGVDRVSGAGKTGKSYPGLREFMHAPNAHRLRWPGSVPVPHYTTASSTLGRKMETDLLLFGALQLAEF